MRALTLAVLVMITLSPKALAYLRADWTRPIEKVLGIQQWEGQKNVVRAVQKHRKVVVTSGHKLGKTHTIASLCCTLMALYPNARIITSASTADQVAENIWGEIRTQYKASLIPLGGRLLPSAPLWQIGPLHYCKGISTDIPESFQGKHSEDGIVFVVLDECQSISREIVQAALTMTSDANGYFLAIANPTKPSGWFYEAATGANGFKRVTLSVLDHPNIIEGRRVMPGPTQALVDQFIGTSDEGPRLTGEFNTDLGSSTILLGNMERSAELDPSTFEQDGKHIGIDLSDGGDFCVATITENRVVTDSIRWRYPSSTSGMETVGKIIQIIKDEDLVDQCWRVHVEADGIGGPIIGRLHEQDFDVEAVRMGGGPMGDWDDIFPCDDEGEPLVQFANRKAELWWVARTLFQEQGICLPEEYGGIRADLAAPDWGHSSAGKVLIEKKDAVKKRLHRSPDDGDSFIVGLSRVQPFEPRIRRLI